MKFISPVLDVASVMSMFLNKIDEELGYCWWETPPKASINRSHEKRNSSHSSLEKAMKREKGNGRLDLVSPNGVGF